MCSQRVQKVTEILITQKKKRGKEKETICKAHLSFFQSRQLIPFYKGSVKTESWYQYLNSIHKGTNQKFDITKVYIMLDRAASQDVAGQRDERRREQKRGRWLNIYRFKEPAFSFFLCRDCTLAIWQNRGSTRGLWPIANELFSACSAARREWSFSVYIHILESTGICIWEHIYSNGLKNKSFYQIWTKHIDWTGSCFYNHYIITLH